MSCGTRGIGAVNRGPAKTWPTLPQAPPRLASESRGIPQANAIDLRRRQNHDAGVRSLFLRYLVIVWSVIWFCAIVPGHQRGAILLPGAPASGSDHSNGPAIEAAAPVCCQREKSSGSKPAPPFGKGCAICDQTAKLTQVPEYNYKPLFLAFLQAAVPPALFTLSGVQFVISPDARGPPAVA